VPSRINIQGKIILIESTKPQSGVNGDILYLGYSVLETWNIHVHHVANTEGHPHSEFVDAKLAAKPLPFAGLSSKAPVTSVSFPEGEPRSPYTDPGTNLAVYFNSLLSNEMVIHLMHDAQPSLDSVSSSGKPTICRLTPTATTPALTRSQLVTAPATLAVTALFYSN
jgi:hypothetical protein